MDESEIRAVWREVEPRAMRYLRRGERYVYALPLHFTLLSNIRADVLDVTAEHLTFTPALRRDLRENCLHYEIRCGDYIMKRGVEQLAAPSPPSEG